MRIGETDQRSFRDLAIAAAEECLERLGQLHAAGHQFDKRSFPAPIRRQDATFKIVEWTSSGDGPLNYSGAFGTASGYKTAISYEDVEGIQALRAFVVEHEALTDWLVPPRIGRDSWREHILTVGVADLPIEVAERHIHLAGWDLDPAVADAVYSQLEYWWLNERLPVELWVPILNVEFDSDEIGLPDGVRVVRLSEKEQLARWPGVRLDGQEDFVAMATHAVVVPGWHFSNEDALRWLSPSDPPEEVSQAERVLESVGVVTDQPSGYVQVVFKPLGWAPGFVGDLPVLLTGSIVPNKRSTYLRPELEPQAVLDEVQLSELANVYAAIAEGGEVALAATRLLSAERRTDDADRIVDICVGLEALLADSQGETTYKIAMRAAAMLARAGTETPSAYVDPLKKMYAYRSAVVHGRKSGRNDTVELNGVRVPVVEFAQSILRRVLSVRLRDQTLAPGAIDRELIGAALDMFATADADEARLDAAGESTGS